MQKESCPACKSTNTTSVDFDGEPWWRCNAQGCSGRISGDWFCWRPGEGLPPPEADAKPAKEAAK